MVSSRACPPTARGALAHGPAPAAGRPARRGAARGGRGRPGARTSAPGRRGARSSASSTARRLATMPAPSPPWSAGTSSTGAVHAGVERPRVVLPEVAQDREVAVEREPRPDRAVVEHLEVGQGGVDALVGPARMGHAHRGLQTREGQARQRRWPQLAGAVVPVTEGVLQADPAAVDQRHAVHRRRPVGGQLEHDVAAPRLPGDHRAVQPEAARRAAPGRRRRSRSCSRRRASPSARGLAGRPRRRGGRPRRAGRRRRATAGRSRPARAPARTGGRCRPTGGRGGGRRRSRAPARSAPGYRSAAANSSSSSRLR